MKFEDMWSRIILDVLPSQWHFDTMLATHMLDTRSSFSGLKFQTYAQFGREPYDGAIDKFLKGGEFNTVFKAPLNDLLIYNGLDSIYTQMLAEILEPQLLNSEPSALNPKYNEIDAYNLYHEGTLAFSDIQINGLPCNDEYYLKIDKKLDKEIKELDKYLHNGEEAKQFKDLYGKEINLKSSQQLGNLFYDVLGYPEQLNDEGNRTTDKNVLKDIELPFVEKLLQHKKLLKVKDTYVKAYIEHSNGGIIHPFINAHTTKTTRSSMQAPNMQNVPNRDKEAKALCRGGLIPSKGFHIGEADYSGIEVAMGCPYHQDPQMITYVTDKTTDMHRDTGMDLFVLNKAQITKDIRQLAKNNFVFPQFYGDYWKQCAANLWEFRDLKTNDEVTLKKHLSKNGIFSLLDFEEHVRKMERTFWDKRFKVYNQWRKDQFQLYLHQGYIDTFTGVRHRGVLNRKDVSNHNIQGEAFRIQFYTLINLNEELKKQKFATKIINQIHDSIIFNMHPEEIDDVFRLMHDIGVTEVMKHYEWINVPLVIDFELAPKDAPWNKKDKYKLKL
jgi:DNA polymerase-1